ncbi:MAG: hypothetical protein JWP63_1279 [Candidatus Solibacter sp.]|nr:hypothetical protein [Candidatus Solibacter sp.]
MLADRAFTDRAPAEIAIGLPVRVSGEVGGFGDDPARIEVDCAYGEKLSISDYQRMVHNSALFVMPNENTVHGLSLPSVPERSLRTHPDSAGRFTTAWFAAYDDPELVVFRQAEAATGVKRVRVTKNVRPGATVPAGRIVPSFGATLEIRSTLSKSELPRGLSVEVESMEVAMGARQEVAGYLSALHRRDPPLSRFLLMRGALPVSLDGPTRIAGIPPAQAIKLRFRGPEPGFEIERTVQVPSRGVVSIDLAAAQVLMAGQGTASFTGTVRVAGGGTPIAGASIVYSSYPDQYETKTAADGRFEIAHVASGRPGLVRIEGTVAGGPPGFDRFAIDRPVAALSAGTNPELVYEITVPSRGARTFTTKTMETAPMQTSGRLGQQGPPLDYKFGGCFAYTQDQFQYVSVPIMTAFAVVDGALGGMVEIAADGSIEPDTAIAVFQAQFRGPGKYAVFLQYTPFVYDAQVVTITKATTTLQFQPRNNMNAIQIRVRGKDKKTAPGGVQLQFPGWSDEPDPYTQETTSDGILNINCVSLNPPGFNTSWNYVNVFVDDPTSGYFSGTLSLPGEEGVLYLNLGERPTSAVKK